MLKVLCDSQKQKNEIIEKQGLTNTNTDCIVAMSKG